ncbi:MAG TPA: hypothetical protein VKS60_24215, partial [Stellaceae bacterium]|nr:hypothetical protein [Stellaceae bacterium]
RIIGQVAAALALSQMDEESAACLAEAEGIVCHLTSLVLVDEAGATQDSLPAMRKVELSVPRTAAMAPAGAPSQPAAPSVAARGLPPAGGHAKTKVAVSEAPRGRGGSFALGLARLFRGRDRDAVVGGLSEPPPIFDLAALARSIDWSSDPQSLRRGDLSRLSAEAIAVIEAAAAVGDIAPLSRSANEAPIVIVLALLAWTVSATDRGARRFARAVLDRLSMDEILAGVKAIGLGSPRKP